MRRIKEILLAAVLLLFAACDEKGVVSSEYIITPLLQREDAGEVVAAANVRAYIFYGDTVDWKVASWEDALAGTITAKEGGETRTSDFTAVPGDDGLLALGPVTQEMFMVLVCYTEPDDVDGGEMYAWRKATTIENMPQISVKVMFKPWQTKGRYAESRWVMTNDNPPVVVPEPEPEPEPNPDMGS